jgi:hypothetical protein
MIFCQACGAQNTDDAKFCNMCGARIAQAGEPGGPLAAKAGPGGAPAGFATAPNAMNNTTSITLAGIGVQSPARTWAILIGGAALFLVVGAGGAWVALRSTGAPPSTAGQDEAGPSRHGAGRDRRSGADRSGHARRWRGHLERTARASARDLGLEGRVTRR